jgi:hypothetical protein
MSARAEANMIRAALGARAHSGWAAVVAVSDAVDESDGAPAVIDRRRIELATGAVPGFPQPYHAAEGLPLEGGKKMPRAEKLVRDCVEAARRLAQEAFSAAIDDLAGRGYRVVACGILAGSGRALPAFEKILASHALLHTAEGEMFRDALRHGAAHNRLSFESIRERSPWEDAAGLLGKPSATLEATLAGMGRALGPPWRQDQKLAALAAWAALQNKTPP